MTALNLIIKGQILRLSEFGWLRTGLCGRLLWTRFLSAQWRCAAWS